MSSRKTIFLVDDDMTNLKVGKSTLSARYNVFTLNSAGAMFDMLENIKPDLILLDVNMPGMDGYEAITRLKAIPEMEHIPVIFLTALRAEDTELKGLTLGAVDYIRKPFSPPLLLKRIEVHLLLEEHTNNLQKLVDEKTATIVALKDAILSTMAELVEYRDEITGNHIIRTQRYIEELIRAMKDNLVYAEEISAMDAALVAHSSQLHDVGKIAISDVILNKPGKLTPEEFEKIKTHTTFGEKVIKQLKEKAMDSDFLEYARIIAVSHHEKWDGSGYPHGLAGDKIPLLGRITAIADVYDALVESRPYKNALPHSDAVAIIQKGRGSHFDPKLCDLFGKIHLRFKTIAEEVGK